MLEPVSDSSNAWFFGSVGGSRLGARPWLTGTKQSFGAPDLPGCGGTPKHETASAEAPSLLPEPPSVSEAAAPGYLKVSEFAGVTGNL